MNKQAKVTEGKRLSMIRLLYTFLWTIVFFFTGQVCYAEVKVPAIFANGMVLQQQSKVSIWGWAKSNAHVKVTCSWNKKTYSAASDAKGRWSIKVETPVAGFKTYTIRISDGKAIAIKDVLIGEVWLCSGQSNMDMPLKGYKNQPVENGAEDVLNASNNYIRLFDLKPVYTTTPQDNCIGNWAATNPETVIDFSATAYYFGQRLFKMLNVPIGLIHASMGGSRIEPWMTPDVLKNFPDVKIPAANDEVIRNQTPTVLYNGMIHPIQGVAIKGTIWYQGESNVSNSKQYEKLFPAMISEWRKLWNIGNFPLYYAQIAPFDYTNRGNSAYLREAQMKSQYVPNTGMAVTMDAQSPNFIHPPKKRVVGERLALWALAIDYGFKVQHKSPAVINVEYKDHAVVLTFDVDANTGLTSYGKEIKNFTISDDTKRFYPALASINGNKIVVVSAMVEKPSSVRYAFDNISESEIFSVNGNLPISSFRTDEW